jgi:hypothetical protein
MGLLDYKHGDPLPNQWVCVVFAALGGERVFPFRFSRGAFGGFRRSTMDRWTRIGPEGLEWESLSRSRVDARRAERASGG